MGFPSERQDEPGDIGQRTHMHVGQTTITIIATAMVVALMVVVVWKIGFQALISSLQTSLKTTQTLP